MAQRLMGGLSKVDRAFLELVRCSLWQAVPREEFFLALSDNDWRQLFRLILKQTEVACCYPVVLQLPRELRPSSDLLLQWFALKEKVLRQNRYHLKVWRKLSERLAELGFKAIVMKGWSFARYYPDPLERMSGDIDLFIPEHYQEVIDKAEERGFHPVRQGHHDSIEYDGVHVEFHASLMNPPVLQLDPHAEMIRLGDEVGVPVPGLEANLMVMLTHMARHLMSHGFALRHVADFLLLWNSEGQRLDRQLLRERLELVGIDRFFDALMHLGQQYLGLEQVFFCHPDQHRSERLGLLLLQDILQNGDDGIQMKRNRDRLLQEKHVLKRWYGTLHYYCYSFIRVFRLRSLWPQYARRITLDKTCYRLRFFFKGQPLHS